jgi:hypothetical protein
VNQELLFNGDCKAFLNAGIIDFIAFLPGTVVWFNDNVLACDTKMSKDLVPFFTDKMFRINLSMSVEKVICD